MRSQHPARVAAGCAVAALLSCVAAQAQTNERAYEDLSFRFVTPGARAASMGRSFVGLADDATAADSNPAGLANLQEREFTVEFTATQIRHHRFVGSVDTSTARFGDFVRSVSFASAVFPMGRVTLAPFRSVSQHYRESFEVPGRSIPAGTVPGQVAFAEDGTFGRIEIDAVNYGLGGSFVATRQIAVGGSVALSVLDLNVMARSGWPSAPRNGTDTRDRSLRPKFTVGVLVKPAPELSVGLAYHGQARHPSETSLFGCFADSTAPPTVCGADRTPHRQTDRTGERRQIDYVIPDRLVAGFSAHLHTSLVVLADIQYVRYSARITDRFQVIDFMTPADRLGRRDFSIRNVTEVHAGGEYRIRTRRRVTAIRFGVFSEPEHQLRFRPHPDTPPHENLQFRFNRIPERTDVGYTVGTGMTFQNRWQLDVALTDIRGARDIAVSLVRRLR